MDKPDDITSVTVKISEALHRKVKATGIGVGRNLEAAYDEALRDWLAKHGVGSQNHRVTNIEEAEVFELGRIRDYLAQADADPSDQVIIQALRQRLKLPAPKIRRKPHSR